MTDAHNSVVELLDTLPDIAKSHSLDYRDVLDEMAQYILDYVVVRWQGTGGLRVLTRLILKPAGRAAAS